MSADKISGLIPDDLYYAEYTGEEASPPLLPIYKFNGGRGATLCHGCRVIINEGFSERLFCDECEPEN